MHKIFYLASVQSVMQKRQNFSGMASRNSENIGTDSEGHCKWSLIMFNWTRSHWQIFFTPEVGKGNRLCDLDIGTRRNNKWSIGDWWDLGGGRITIVFYQLTYVANHHAITCLRSTSSVQSTCLWCTFCIDENGWISRKKNFFISLSWIAETIEKYAFCSGT